MKIHITGAIFIISILILLIFQAVWLYSTFLLEKGKIETTFNQFLREAVKEEVLIRHEREWDKEEQVSFERKSEGTKEIMPDIPSVTIDLEDVSDNGFLQQLLDFAGHKFKIQVLDSIFKQKITETNLDIDYVLYHKDSTGYVKDSLGNLPLSKVSYTSDPVPIVNGNYVNTHAYISVPVVFKQMIGLTIASFCMLLLLLLALTYQIRFIYNQYRLSKLREDFSHALIHDIKSPLNVIQIVLSNYKSGLFEKESEFRVKSTDIALDQVLNIQTLMDKILTIAQLEDNKLHLSRTEINLPALTHRLIEKYTLAGGKEIKFETHYALNNFPVFADETLIENAISNLIDNAIKYSKETVDIHISGEIEEGKLYIKIKDNGFGISQEDQLSIFNKFERGSAIFRKGAKGFGLGLSYVRQVAIAHRGTVALYSQKGKGCEFVMIIPLLLTPYEEDMENKNKSD